jgi:carbon monoxide dehydrogenase subunit G
MELEGTKMIPVPRARVWELLNDPEVLKSCIPGCTEMAGSAEEGFTATVVQKVGPVKATFKGAVALSNVVEEESYTISGEGKGGVAGFAKGAANVWLTDVEGGTELSYKVDAQVGGKLAQLGNRIIGGFAKTMADKFFEGFVTAAGGALPAGDAAPAA